MVVVCDFGNGGDVLLTLDRQQLGISGKVTAADVATGRALEASGDREVRVPLKKHDFMLVRIAGRAEERVPPMKTPSVAWAWAMLVLAAAFTSNAAAAGAGDNPSPYAGNEDNPAIARFGRSIILYVSLDGHEFAEITEGDAKPTGNAQWALAAKDAARLYASGVFGQGMRSGRHQLVFTSPKTTLGTTGSMALWLKPEQLHHRGTYFWPVILDALEGRYRVIFGRMGSPANRERLYAASFPRQGQRDGRRATIHVRLEARPVALVRRDLGQQRRGSFGRWQSLFTGQPAGAHQSGRRGRSARLPPWRERGRVRL